MSTSPAREQFGKALEHFRHELSLLRTGRATPALVEGLQVEYYGARTPLIQLASISTPDAKSIIIQPWDQAAIKDIEKALQQSSLGINPVNEGKLLRVVIPPLTEERRNELIKLIGKHSEDARVRIRTAREDVLKKLTTEKTDGSISEDEYFRKQKDLQREVDEVIASIKTLSEAKEQELKTI